MRRGKAQDLAESVIPANQLGNRLRQVRRRQLSGDPPISTSFLGIGLGGVDCLAGVGLRAAVDAAYRAKYGRYGSASVDRMVTAEAAAATLRLIPAKAA